MGGGSVAVGSPPPPRAAALPRTAEKTNVAMVTNRRVPRPHAAERRGSAEQRVPESTPPRAAAICRGTSSAEGRGRGATYSHLVYDVVPTDPRHQAADIGTSRVSTSSAAACARRPRGTDASDFFDFPSTSTRARTRSEWYGERSCACARRRSATRTPLLPVRIAVPTRRSRRRPDRDTYGQNWSRNLPTRPAPRW